MKALSKKTNLYAYLVRTGVLDKGTEDEIKAAKKAYWKEYDRLQKKQKRAVEHRLVTVIFPREDINHVRAKAKEMGYSLQDYIRSCVTADMKKTSVIAHKHIYLQILQEVAGIRRVLEELIHRERKQWLGVGRESSQALLLLEKLNKDITAYLTYDHQIINAKEPKL